MSSSHRSMFSKCFLGDIVLLTIANPSGDCRPSLSVFLSAPFVSFATRVGAIYRPLLHVVFVRGRESSKEPWILLS